MYASDFKPVSPPQHNRSQVWWNTLQWKRLFFFKLRDLWICLLEAVRGIRAGFRLQLANWTERKEDFFGTLHGPIPEVPYEFTKWSQGPEIKCLLMRGCDGIVRHPNGRQVLYLFLNGPAIFSAKNSWEEETDGQGKSRPGVLITREGVSATECWIEEGGGGGDVGGFNIQGYTHM